MTKCQVCGVKITPGGILCGDKQCFYEWSFRHQLKPKDAAIRREYIVFMSFEIQRTHWIERNT